MKIKLTEMAQIQVANYLKAICGVQNPTAEDIEKEVNDIIATKMHDYPYLTKENTHIYFKVKGIAIEDPLYDETGRYALPDPVHYWIDLGVNRDVAIEAVNNAQINAC